MASTSALDGVRVVDFGQYIAGPLTAMFLADQGADVIRIDPPGGERHKTPANATWNRGKRSIVLDLKQEDDRAIARQLIGNADVIIENFRPGVMSHLGLGPAEMTAENPALIYCSLPGFSSNDPRAKVKAWEGVLGAATGAYRPNPKLKNNRPIYTVLPFSSIYGAFLASVSIAAGLVARARSGLGQIIEVPLFNATFNAIGSRAMKNHRNPDVRPPFEWNRQLRCKDGRWFMYVWGNKKFESFLDQTGMKQWRDAGLSPDELGKHFDEIFLTRTSAEWDRFCAELGTEGGICHTSAEWLAHPQALESQTVADFDDPVLGRFRGPGVFPRLSETPGVVRSPRPHLNAHREAILKELAEHVPATFTRAEEHDIRSALQGIKVVDLCIILAGPTCGRTLAEFGADVIKIDGPNRKAVQRHNDVNRGKRSMVLDLKTEEGKKILWELIDRADVVLQNFRNGVAEKLGFGYEAVRARRPDIVYCSMNTYGQTGPQADRPGHEHIAQAVSGMQMRFGGARPVLASFPVNDYGTGLMAAYGVCLALLHRLRTGKGQHVSNGLAYTATMLQSSLLQDFPGKKWDEPSGQDALGQGPLYRAYQASDGWLFLATSAEEMKKCPELVDINAGPSLEKDLEARFLTRSADEWVSCLNQAGVGAHRIVAELDSLMEDPNVRRQGLSLTRDHEEMGPITTTGTAVTLSRHPVAAGRPAPKPGSDAASILDEIGRRGDLERLVGQRVVWVDGIKVS